MDARSIRFEYLLLDDSLLEAFFCRSIDAFSSGCDLDLERGSSCTSSLDVEGKLAGGVRDLECFDLERCSDRERESRELSVFKIKTNALSKCSRERIDIV